MKVSSLVERNSRGWKKNSETIENLRFSVKIEISEYRKKFKCDSFIIINITIQNSAYAETFEILTFEFCSTELEHYEIKKSPKLRFCVNLGDCLMV